MKKILCVITALLMFLPAAFASDSREDMTYDQVKERMENPYSLNLIDIRPSEEYDAGHLKLSMNIPFDALQDEFQAIMDSGYNYMETEIILCGDDAGQCQQAVQLVKGFGFTNVSYMADVSHWPYTLVTTAEDQRILGGMEAVDIYGAPVTEAILADYQLTMVNVWATFCNPCISEMPELAKLAQDMKDQDVQIIGIVSDALDYYMNRDEDNILLAQEIAESTGADYIHVVPDLMVAVKLLPQISAVPTTFFLDENGLLVGGVYSGSRNYQQWKDIVEDTLAQLQASGDGQ